MRLPNSAFAVITLRCFSIRICAHCFTMIVQIRHWASTRVIKGCNDKKRTHRYFVMSILLSAPSDASYTEHRPARSGTIQYCHPVADLRISLSPARTTCPPETSPAVPAVLHSSLKPSFAYISSDHCDFEIANLHSSPSLSGSTHIRRVLDPS